MAPPCWQTAVNSPLQLRTVVHVVHVVGVTLGRGLQQLREVLTVSISHGHVAACTAVSVHGRRRGAAGWGGTTRTLRGLSDRAWPAAACQADA